MLTPNADQMGVALVTKYAQHLGATARRVHLFTVEQPWNDYDDGFLGNDFLPSNPGYA